MIETHGVPLSSLTTLRVGGPVATLIDCASVNELQTVVANAIAHNQAWRVLGGGSNVLASDTGFEGTVFRLRDETITSVEEGDTVLVTAAAGASWEALVRYAAEHVLWGIENLAGIPGTVGAAPVQNIGAYGVEIKDTFHHLTTLHAPTGRIETWDKDTCAFGYRDSKLKHNPNWIVLSVTFALTRTGNPHTEYTDLVRARDAGIDLSTPGAIGEAVRAIRARKFPDTRVIGTAGSFFKNPSVDDAILARIRTTLPDIPTYPGTHGTKIPLAYLLDKGLQLRGYQQGHVALYEAQPLVLVAYEGATATEINLFADTIASRVHETFGVRIEREVRLFP